MLAVVIFVELALLGHAGRTTDDASLLLPLPPANVGRPASNIPLGTLAIALGGPNALPALEVAPQLVAGGRMSRHRGRAFSRLAVSREIDVQPLDQSVDLDVGQRVELDDMKLSRVVVDNMKRAKGQERAQQPKARRQGAKPQKDGGSRRVQVKGGQRYARFQVPSLTSKKNETAEVPTMWLDKFKAGSIRFKSCGCRDLAGSGSCGKVFTASLREAPKTRVDFKVLPADSLAARRELHLMGMCRVSDSVATSTKLTSGHVISYYDNITLAGKTFLLMEAMASDLERFVDGAKKFATSNPDRLYIPLATGLVLLVDILEGLRAMEEAGLLHAALSPANIGITRKGPDEPFRAVVSGFDAVCQTDATDSAVRCRALADAAFRHGPFVTSPVNQAPEIVNGAPTGSSNHVWSAGLLFARICFGYSPIDRFIVETMPEELADRIMTSASRRRIRAAIAETFDIQQDMRFHQTSCDIQRLIQGMLDPRPETRWTTAEALVRARELAKDRQISLPPARQPIRLRSSWWAGRAPSSRA